MTKQERETRNAATKLRRQAQLVLLKAARAATKATLDAKVAELAGA